MTKTITMKELFNLAQNDEVNIIDVREPLEYKIAHIPGSVNMPLSRIGRDYDKLDKSKSYHIVCLSGGRSARGADFLNQHGFHAINVNTGTPTWPGKLER